MSKMISVAEELRWIRRFKTTLNRARNIALDMGLDEKSPLGKALTDLQVELNLRESDLGLIGSGAL